MNRLPTTIGDVAQFLAAASALRQKVGIVDLSTLDRVLEYTQEDLTVSVQAGISLGALQKALAQHRQWLPIDPPHAERLSIRDLLDQNPSGPRRYGHGTIRDHLIGITVALANGTIIHSGGKVVKNVAGYDLLKLFVGARGSLGLVLEATFKLRPLPEAEQFVQAQCETLGQADKLIESVIHSDVTPVVLDLAHPARDQFIVVLGFAGAREDVEWQLQRVKILGFNEPSAFGYEAKFWDDPAPAQRLSVLPSKLAETLAGLEAPFIARAGNGVIFHRGGATRPKEKLPLELMRRVKAAYDPDNILPDMPA